MPKPGFPIGKLGFGMPNHGFPIRKLGFGTPQPGFPIGKLGFPCPNQSVAVFGFGSAGAAKKGQKGPNVINSLISYRKTLFWDAKTWFPIRKLGFGMPYFFL